MTDLEDTRPPGPDFDALYRAHDDPWQVSSSWYERRKSDVVLAVLPREHYHRGWEPACGPGVTTARLAPRVDRLVASDASRVAVALAERRLSGLENRPELHCSALPGTPLTTAVDLVVVAECLYYLDDVPATLETIWSVAAPGAHLVFVHWRGAPHDTRLSGPQVHEAVSHAAWQRGAARLVALTDAGFQLDVYEVAS